MNKEEKEAVQNHAINTMIKPKLIKDINNFVSTATIEQLYKLNYFIKSLEDKDFEDYDIPTKEHIESLLSGGGT